MNPITTGHELLVKKLNKVARQKNADVAIYLSQSQDPKKNPLPYLEKIRYAKAAFGPIVKVSRARTVIEVLKELDKDYDNVVMVVGSDRVPEFQQLLNKYNQKDFTFDSVEVVSAGARDPDATDVTGMSASKMREFAREGDLESFRMGLPDKLKRRAEEIFKKVRKGMKLKEDVLPDVPGDQPAQYHKGLKKKTKKSRAAQFARQTKMADDDPRAYRPAPGDKDAETKPSKYTKRYRQMYGEATEIGGTEYEYLELCPAAIERFKKDFEEFGDSEKLRDAIEAVDNYLEIEGMVLDRGYATQADVERITRRIAIAKMKIKEAGLSGHTYHQSHLNKVKGMLNEDLIPMVEQEMACPTATQNVDVNTKNRNLTRRNHMYGPLNVSEPGDYWEKLADKWDTTVEAAKKSTCGVCVAFDISPRMKDCMPGTVSEGAGELGYCWMHHFKCHSKRSCDTWASGGPITKDDKSYEWQEKAFGSQMDEARKKMSPAEKILKRFEKEAGYSLDQSAQFYQAMSDFYKGKRKERPTPSEFGLKEEVGMMIEKQIKGLKKKAEKTGIPYSILKDVYDRGMAAWKTGHRPGATQHQWAFARVNSFITGGKTQKGADKDLWDKVDKRKLKDEYEMSDLNTLLEQYLEEVEGTRVLSEPAVSKAQQQAAGAALAAKRGEIPVSSLVGASKDMYDSMTEKELEDFASTEHEGLPKKVNEQVRGLMQPGTRFTVKNKEYVLDKVKNAVMFGTASDGTTIQVDMYNKMHTVSNIKESDNVSEARKPPFDVKKVDYKAAAKELRDYAKKLPRDHIDRDDMLSVSSQLDALGKRASSGLLARVMRDIQSMDTSPREKIFSVMDNNMSESQTLKQFDEFYLEEKYSWNDVNKALTKANWMRGNPKFISDLAKKFDFRRGNDKKFSDADIKKAFDDYGIKPATQHDIMKNLSEEVDTEKLLAALKKKLSDEGGAAGFEPLKDVAKEMGVDLTPEMLKSMDGIKQHRDGDYILEKLQEARRGRPKKNPEDEESENMIMQLRKVITLRGMKPVEFADGTTAKIDPKDAQLLLNLHQALAKSNMKLALQNMMSRSKRDFDKAVKLATGK